MGRNIINRIGEINVNTQGEEMKIIECNSAIDIKVLFLKTNNIREHCAYKDFKLGNIKDCMYPSVYGVGYLGSYNVNKRKDKSYECWRGMIKRCYNENSRNKYRTYEGCIVCDEWHNFSTFREWYYKNYYELEDEKVCLDKDLLVLGNKIYSPETCCFLPNSINVALTYKQRTNNKLPIGVHRERHKFRADISGGKSNIYKHIGTFDTKEEAAYQYIKYKKKQLSDLADKYKNVLSSKAYESLKKYDIEKDIELYNN